MSAGYGTVPVLRDVSLAVPKGELVALLGPNGAGKTTLLNAVMGIAEVSAGSISHDGIEIAGLPLHGAARRGICYIPEGRAIFRSLTVLDNLRMFAGGTVLPEHLDRVYDTFPVLAERSNQLAGTFSGGQQQMLALSRSIVRPNTALLLDELSHGLSPILVDEFMQVIVTLKEADLAILLVEQYAERALDAADAVYVMHKGSIAFAGESCELRDSADLMNLYAGTGADEDDQPATTWEPSRRSRRPQPNTRRPETR